MSAPKRLTIRVSGVIFLGVLGVVYACSLASAAADTPQPSTIIPPAGGDIPPHFVPPPADDQDYVLREVMIPMRDGVRLHTVIVIPRNATNAPIVLTRTPYNALRRMTGSMSPHMLARLSRGDDVFVMAGYIRVYQDVRGKYQSEGNYVMTLPARGPLNPTMTDESTDAWDTIDWLVKNTPESNGLVGMIGNSYDGFTVAMALLDPHPALKVAAAESPMVDGWMGDDWFHYGAFRQINIEYILRQTRAKDAGEGVARGALDDYQAFLAAGSAGEYGRAAGLDQLPFWTRLTAHPAYDAFWQGQALDHLLAKRPLRVPTMWVQGLWDQEDIWGAVHCYAALKDAGARADTNRLVMGPWSHGQANRDGSSLGPLQFFGDTALQFRRDLLAPFFAHHLSGGPPIKTPAVQIYNTGENHWDGFETWPAACERGCASGLTPLYLGSRFSLSLDHPAAAIDAFDSYVSDPEKPVPYQSRPLTFANGDRWAAWLVTDQRSYSDRADVLTYESAPLTAPVRISGAPVADLYAATSGTDADWVVKLIDVWPDEVPSKPELGGYQLGISMDIFRGRYRKDLERPVAIPANQIQRYRFALPAANHVFQPGHRIMVQIQSSWFPLYDRNPQTYVPNIFFARPADYVSARQRVYRDDTHRSALWLPLIR
jgi:putative CocE/NonD family hydrolase